MTDPLVYVLVINWNGKEHLEECFDTLLVSTHPNTKYILLDNASDDDSVEFVRNRYGDNPDVAILECGANLGWSGGNNKGMEYALKAGADYIFLLNNDTRIAPDAISDLVYQAEADRTIGALSPKILLYDNPTLINSVGLEATIIGSSWDKGIGRADGPRWDKEEDIIGVCGAAMFIRSNVLRQSGLLPIDFEIYLDDLDLSLRIWMAGYTIRSCPKAKVWHKFSATMGTGSRSHHKYYLNTRNRARIIMRNYPLRQIPLIKFLYMKGECKAMGRALLDGEWWRVWAHLKSWFAIMAYFPKSIPSRLRSRGNHSRFWPMVLREPLFFPGTVFPENGFYPAEKIGDKDFHPISTLATYKHPGGSLRIESTCPEGLDFTPKLSISINKAEPITLSAKTPFHEDHIPAGEIYIKAECHLSAEVSGRLYDIGGWVSITQGEID